MKIVVGDGKKSEILGHPPFGAPQFGLPHFGASLPPSLLPPSRRLSLLPGLEFIADDPPALQQFNLALRRWCRQYTGNLASVMLCTLPLDALSRFSGACVCCRPPLLALRSLPVCSGSPRLRWVPGHTGARLLSTLSPSRSLPTWVSLLALRPRHSTGGSPVKSVHVCTVPFVTHSLPWFLICMVSSLTLSLTTSSLSGRTPCTPLTCLLLPFVFGLARWGHDHSGRPSRHRQGPSTCPFCHDHSARTAWALSCGVSLSKSPTLTQHSWVFTSLDEANTPQTIRAHNLFVGCESTRVSGLNLISL